MEAKPIKVVYVTEDEALIASFLTKILRISGFRVMEFTSPEDARSIAGSECPTHL